MHMRVHFPLYFTKSTSAMIISLPKLITNLFRMNKFYVIFLCFIVISLAASPSLTYVEHGGNMVAESTCEVKLVIVMCDGEEKIRQSGKTVRTGTSFRRQISQTVVLIKSLLISSANELPDDCLNLIVVSNSQKSFNKLQNFIYGKNGSGSWDTQFTGRLRLSYVPLAYPEGTEWMELMFRPCSTFRLFLPELLLAHDSVIYLDTDLIFLRSVRELWSQFKLFDSEQIAALSPGLAYYGNNPTSFRVPYYDSTGLQSGVMLMNLTRMRSIGWTKKMTEIGAQYRSKLIFPDQDMLNAYFASNPSEVFELDCDWNFRSIQCRPQSVCPAENGISVLHGNHFTFTPHGPDTGFYQIFKSFQNTQLSKDFCIDKVIAAIEQSLELERKNGSSTCARFAGFQKVVLQRLQKATRVEL